MNVNFTPKGVCARNMSFDIENGVIRNLKVMGGCNGNLKAVSKLCDGMTADEIAGKLLGNTCGFRDTSCADQLSKAVIEAKSKL